MSASEQYKKNCIEILKEQGPLLGSELQELLVEISGVKPNNARQIIYRLKENNEFLSTEPVRFQRNQVLYYLPTHNLKQKLREVMPEHAKTIDRVYHSLVEQDGFLFWHEFAKISGGVVAPQQSGKKTAEQIYREMRELGIVRDLYDFQGIPVVIANLSWVPKLDDSAGAMFKRQQDLSFDRIFTGDLLKWLERMNFVGWNSTYLTDEDDFDKGYNGFYWDAIGYCYLWGLYRTEQKESLFNPAEVKKGSLVVVESILHRITKRHDISGLIDRVNSIYGPVKEDKYFKIIPICFVESIAKDALELARKRGIWVITISDVFGAKIAETLKTIRNIDPRNVDAEALAKLLAEAEESGQDGKFGSLKGYAFNFLVASIFSEYGYKPKIGSKYKDPNDTNKKCECDIVAPIDDDNVIVCEVKGYNQGIEVQLGESEEEKDTVKKFFERTRKIVENKTGKKVLPIFITSAGFSNEAINYMEDINKSKKIRTILEGYNFPSSVYYDRDALMEIFSNNSKYTEHKRVLREFFKNPKN